MKCRLDQLVVERGLAPSREAARRLILAGKIWSGGERRDKPGRALDAEAALELRGESSRYVGRGGEKLEGALRAFDLEIEPGALGLDIGASTGGFTDCLLQHGAGRVIAVDTGRGQIHERLRGDPRVELREKTNARYLTLEAIGGTAADWIVIDVSFISLRLILPACKECLKPGGRVLALVKPQFEAGRRQVGSGGVVRDRAVHREVLGSLAEWCAGHGWRVLGMCASPLRGAKGNLEFFFHLVPSAAAAPAEIDIEGVLDDAYNQADPPSA